MSGVASKFVSTSETKDFLKPNTTVSKTVGEATGKAEKGNNVQNPPAGTKPSANFRQVGRVPDDKYGFKVQHLGDKK